MSNRYLSYEIPRISVILSDSYLYWFNKILKLTMMFVELMCKTYTLAAGALLAFKLYRKHPWKGLQKNYLHYNWNVQLTLVEFSWFYNSKRNLRNQSVDRTYMKTFHSVSSLRKKMWSQIYLPTLQFKCWNYNNGCQLTLNYRQNLWNHSADRT